MSKWKLRFFVKIFVFGKIYFVLHVLSWAILVSLTSYVLATRKKKCIFIGKLGLPALFLTDTKIWRLMHEESPVWWDVPILLSTEGSPQGWVQLLGVDNKHYPEPALKNVGNLKCLHRQWVILPSFKLLKVEYHPEGREKTKRKK